jgi:hypothetical protein
MTQHSSKYTGEREDLELPAADNKQENDWSPIQFSLKWMLSVTTFSSIAFCVINYTGPEVIFPTIALAMAIWVSWRSFGLVRLSARKKLEEKPKEKSKSE